MAESRWVIRSVSDETQKLLKLHATFRSISIGEMLEIVVNEWNEAHPVTSSATPSQATDADTGASENK